MARNKAKRCSIKLPSPWWVKEMRGRIKDVCIVNSLYFLMRGEEPVVMVYDPKNKESILEAIEAWNHKDNDNRREEKDSN